MEQYVNDIIVRSASSVHFADFVGDMPCIAASDG
jgi:hypothetical protein